VGEEGAAESLQAHSQPQDVCRLPHRYSSIP